MHIVVFGFESAIDYTRGEHLSVIFILSTIFSSKNEKIAQYVNYFLTQLELSPIALFAVLLMKNYFNMNFRFSFISFPNVDR